MTELNKLNLKSLDGTSENIEKIEKLFPNCITESKDENGNLKKSINFDVLKQLLSKDIAEGREYYEFTWPGKKAAILEANSPITKTLRPCVEDSKDWQNTKNLYIEGDNLEVLKILQESYLGKVKMIYIDPPYNTGKDFVYKDDFSLSKEEYSKSVGQKDENDNKLFSDINLKSNPKFHSDWCSMIYSRLFLARNILSEDGVIFISIDENELSNMLKLCNEIYGEDNIIGVSIRKTKSTTGDDGNNFNLQHEYLLIYSKNKEKVHLKGELKKYNGYSNPDNDPNGDWCSGDPSAKSGSQSTYFGIENPYTNDIDYPPQGRYWAFSKSTLDEYIISGKVKFKKKTKQGERGFIFKRYKKDLDSSYDPFSSLAFANNSYMNQVATKELNSIFDDRSLFSYPKPVSFIKDLIGAYSTEGTVLDFFSGSATTAHAVMQLNAEEGGDCQFIMVQLPEIFEEKSSAYKAGYKNICEIGKVRIRRAGEQIKKEHPDSKVDVGFRVFKVDSSNMKDVYYNPEKLNQELLSSLESNVKEDRTDYDLLFSTILDLGLTLDKEVKEETIGDTKVYIYNDDEKEGPVLIACFADNITEDVITAIAKRNPLKAVFKDSSFENSPSKINLFELFKTYANISKDNELQCRVRVI